MAYQNPAYLFLHVGADAGDAGVFVDVTESTTYPKRNLIDYRQSSLFKWTNAATYHDIKFNRGAAGLELVNRMIIPAGHNLSGAAYELRSNTADSWGGTIRASGTFGSGLQDISVSGSSTQQWWRLEISTSGTWEIPELWLSNRRVPTGRGPNPFWEARKIPALTEVPFPARSATLALGPNRWLYRVAYDRLDGTDLAVIDDLMDETGIGLVPFYFDPPDDTLDPVLVKVNDFTRRQQARTNLTTGMAYNVEFSMIEQAG
jgi:hypothetical protein